MPSELKTLQARVSDEQLVQIDALCAQLGIDRQAYVRQLVRADFEARGIDYGVDPKWGGPRKPALQYWGITPDLRIVVKGHPEYDAIRKSARHRRTIETPNLRIDVIAPLELRDQMYSAVDFAETPVGKLVWKKINEGK